MLSFKTWSMGAKLRGLNFVLLGNMVALGVISYWSNARLRDFDLQMANQEIPAIEKITMLDMVHDSLNGCVYRSLYLGGHASVSEKKELSDNCNEKADEFRTLSKDLDALKLADSVRSALQLAETVMPAYAESMRKIVNASLDGKLDEAKSLLPEFDKNFTALEAKLDALRTTHVEATKGFHKINEDFMNFSWWLNTLNLIFALLVGIFLPFFVIRNLLASLNSAINELAEDSQRMKEAARDVHSASEDLSSATTQQAAALQQTASSIEQMNTMIKKSSENTLRSQEVSNRSHDAAERGKRSVDSMIKAIDEINVSNDNIMKQTEESNRRISDIVKVIQEIGNKTKIINDIVFQTKLLSFNASVEAARAGEHGKGFAVVAEEVGNLAQVSGNAAKEISDMLGDSISQVEAIVNETKRNVERLVQEGRNKVQSGTHVARECGTVLEEVVRNVEEVRAMMSEIGTATQEQSQGISEITRAMNQLDQVVHQNAGTSRQVAAAAGDLTGESENLDKVTQFLTALVHGGSAHPTSHLSAPQKAKVSFKPAKETLKPTSLSPKVKLAPFSKDSEATEVVNPKPTSTKKVVAGGGDPIPSEDDSRFMDI